MKKSTSWQSSAKWYEKSVGEKGHFYHQRVIFPKLLPLLDLKPESSLLDLGCGQGVLSRKIPESCNYLGIDSSPSFIAFAKKQAHSKKHCFLEADLSKPVSFSPTFSHSCFLLSLQNMGPPEIPLQNACKHLKPGGKLVLVLNHPCFRIPRQSSWGIDPASQIQYRRIDSYLTFQKIPIQMEPGKNPNKVTYSFHFSLSELSQILSKNHLLMEQIQEWVSPKISQGKQAKRENRARKEIPLFLALSALYFPKK